MTASLKKIVFILYIGKNSDLFLFCTSYFIFLYNIKKIPENRKNRLLDGFSNLYHLHGMTHFMDDIFGRPFTFITETCANIICIPFSHLVAEMYMSHHTVADLVCRLLLEKNNQHLTHI